MHGCVPHRMHGCMHVTTSQATQEAHAGTGPAHIEEIRLSRVVGVLWALAQHAGEQLIRGVEAAGRIDFVPVFGFVLRATDPAGHRCRPWAAMMSRLSRARVEPLRQQG